VKSATMNNPSVAHPTYHNPGLDCAAPTIAESPGKVSLAEQVEDFRQFHSVPDGGTTMLLLGAWSIHGELGSSPRNGSPAPSGESHCAALGFAAYRGSALTNKIVTAGAGFRTMSSRDLIRDFNPRGTT